MELLIFDRENTFGKHRNEEDFSIRVMRDSGRVSFSLNAQNLLDLKEGGFILIAQDETKKNDWYVCRTNDRQKGIEVKINKGTVFFINCFLADKILNQFKIEEGAVFFLASTPVESSGHTWYRILTSCPVIIKPRATGSKKKT